MFVTADQIKEIVETLPIGFYAHSRVEVQMDNNAPTSYFVPNTRQIFISSKIIQKALAKIDCPQNEMEMLVRGQVYHELSHAILTPHDMDCGDIYNIFEDERIERLLDDYYYNVDFEWQIKTICDFENLQKPTSAIEYFYQIVRFRVGKQEFIERVEKLIKKYKDLNWNSSSLQVGNYCYEIYYLFRDINDDFEKNPPTQEDFEKQYQQAKGENSQEVEQAEIPEEYDQTQTEEENEGEGEGEDESEENYQEGDTQSTDNEKEGQGEMKAPLKKKGKGAGNKLADKLFNNAIENRVDTTFYQQVENILNGFNKKNSGGGAVGSYSGIFNPRSAGREDYRFFDRQTAVRTSNRYGTFHLNLFIDNSGSFSSNAKMANQIIATLCDLERKYPFFTVDFALCGNGVVRCENRKQAFVSADECTRIQNGADKIVRDMQKPNTMNCNIVLYDGTAHSAYTQVYKPFDLRNATLILDRTCMKDSRSVKNAKVVLCQNYLQELKEEILKALQNALR